MISGTDETEKRSFAKQMERERRGGNMKDLLRAFREDRLESHLKSGMDRPKKKRSQSMTFSDSYLHKPEPRPVQKSNSITSVRGKPRPSVAATQPQPSPLKRGQHVQPVPENTTASVKSTPKWKRKSKPQYMRRSMSFDAIQPKGSYQSNDSSAEVVKPSAIKSTPSKTNKFGVGRDVRTSTNAPGFSVAAKTNKTSPNSVQRHASPKVASTQSRSALPRKNEKANAFPKRSTSESNLTKSDDSWMKKSKSTTSTSGPTSSADVLNSKTGSAGTTNRAIASLKKQNRTSLTTKDNPKPAFKTSVPSKNVQVHKPQEKPNSKSSWKPMSVLPQSRASATSTSPDELKCPDCGAPRLRAGSMFCKECGRKLQPGVTRNETPRVPRQRSLSDRIAHFNQ